MGAFFEALAQFNKEGLGMSKNVYQSPLSRYASKEMQWIFSPDRKFSTWRRLWVALAKAEQELGLTTESGDPITDEQIAEMEAHIDDINYDVAAEWEKKIRHDVMAHVHAFGEQCPKAAGIIHLGATSCFVTDNTDILNLRDALKLVSEKTLGAMKLLGDFADKYKDLPILGRTHGQPASVVTVGKRATLWLQDFEIAWNMVDFASQQLKMLGCRGATGTADSFMGLFDGDEKKVWQLEEIIADEMGFNGEIFPVSGQTYPRILDVPVQTALTMVTTAAYKMANDIRILQAFKEMEEPFEKDQVGSSAMPYKRNPMRSERVCSLSRYVSSQPTAAAETAAVQWFERTLDDSAIRRITLPEAFLVADGVLILVANIVDGLVVNEAIIKRHLREELPFMAEEKMIMTAVKKGMNRQEAHECMRQHSMAASDQVKKFGKDNDLIERVANDENIPLTMEELQAMLDPNRLTGCAASQVTKYLEIIKHEYSYIQHLDASTINKNVEV